MRSFVQELPGKVVYFSDVSTSFSVSVWKATPHFRRVQEYWMFICSLENSLIHFLICVEFLGLKDCGMLSINWIFGLELEFLKSTGRLLVPNNCFVLDSGGFSVWLMLVPCVNGWFVFWFIDATNISFDDEWICFDWSVVIEECAIWFSVWDWQDTDLLALSYNCKMSIPNVFAERILHLRHLKNRSL